MKHKRTCIFISEDVSLPELLHMYLRDRPFNFNGGGDYGFLGKTYFC